jgi:hypothetical protein
MATFQEYKNKVSILQLAEYLGYKPLKERYTKARPVLRDANGDTILIKNPTNPSIQVYWNLNNSLQHGSVIDFVKNNIGRFGISERTEIDSINKILSHFSGIPYDNSSYKQSPLSEQRIFNEADYQISIPEIRDLHYLTGERKLSPETVQAFIPFIRLVENGGYKNIGFPFVIADQDEKIRGYELRNYGFKSFSAGGDKINASWIADFSTNKNEVRNIFFFESAIDAMSYFQVKKGTFDPVQSVFVSSGGFPGIQQFAHVINGYPGDVRLYGCHDNDLQGQLFNIMLACVKENKSCIKNKLGDKVEFITNDKKFSLLHERVSLANFYRFCGFESSVKAKKPGGKDWNAILQNQHVKTSDKKPVFGGKRS